MSVFKDCNQINFRKFLYTDFLNTNKLNCISDTGDVNDENSESNEEIEDYYCTISKSEDKILFI